MSESEHAIELLDAAIRNALQKADVGDVLAFVTGAFVGLTEEILRRSGQDVTKEIRVDGGDERDITLHAPKC